MRKALPGDFNQTTEVAPDPVAQLERFIEMGAEMVHIVDLDGAKTGRPAQFELIASLCKTAAVPVEVGGGIRNLDTVHQYAEIGVSRIVLGTAAIENRDF